MKKHIFLILSFSLILLSCGKNEKKTQLLTGLSSADLSPKGTISFYAGSQTGLSTIAYKSIKKTVIYNDFPINYTLRINKIEISTNGEEWIEVLNGSTDITITKNEVQSAKVGTSVSVNEDEYHGIRIWFEPKINIHILGDGTSYETEINKAPDVIAIRQGGGTQQFQNPVEWTTKNGGLTAPFNVEIGKEIFIILDVLVNTTTPPENWYTYIYIRTTRFM